MKIVVRCKDIFIGPSLERQVREQIDETMTSYSHRIAKVTMNLKTVIGSANLPETQCCIEVRVKRLQTVVSIERDENTRAAIDRCITQAAGAAVRLLEKQQYERYKRNIGRFSFARPRPQALA